MQDEISLPPVAPSVGDWGGRQKNGNLANCVHGGEGTQIPGTLRGEMWGVVLQLLTNGGPLGFEGT